MCDVQSGCRQSIWTWWKNHFRWNSSSLFLCGKRSHECIIELKIDFHWGSWCQSHSDLSKSIEILWIDCLVEVCMLLIYFQLLSSNLPQNGEDEEGIYGFLPADILKEKRRASKKVTFCIDFTFVFDCFDLIRICFFLFWFKWQK